MQRTAEHRICNLMARYYFHVRDPSGFSRDPDGVVLSDIAAARRFATAGARSLICDDVTRGLLDLRGSIEVTDEADNIVLIVRLEETVLRAV